MVVEEVPKLGAEQCATGVAVLPGEWAKLQLGWTKQRLVGWTTQVLSHDENHTAKNTKKCDIFKKHIKHVIIDIIW